MWGGMYTEESLPIEAEKEAGARGSRMKILAYTMSPELFRTVGKFGKYQSCLTIMLTLSYLLTFPFSQKPA